LIQSELPRILHMFCLKSVTYNLGKFYFYGHLVFICYT
jgi:hypothetical protein